MSARRKPLSPAAAEEMQRQIERLRERSIANPDTLLPGLEKEAAHRLRKAGLPDTYEALVAVENFIDGNRSGRRKVIDRITSDATLPLPLRNSANLLWYAHQIRKQIAQGGSGAGIFANTVRLIGCVTSTIVAEVAPDVAIARQRRETQAAAAKLAAKQKNAKKERRYALVCQTFDELRVKNRRLSMTAMRNKVAAAWRDPQDPGRRVCSSTVANALKWRAKKSSQHPRDSG